jgi:hypothetical protein
MPVRGASHPRSPLSLKFSAERFVRAMQDSLWREREAAWTTTFRVLIGMGQHHLVHVDVAVIGRQLFGVPIGDGDLRQEAQHNHA